MTLDPDMLELTEVTPDGAKLKRDKVGKLFQITAGLPVGPVLPD